MVCSVDDRRQSKGLPRRRVIQGDYRAPIGKKFVHKTIVSCSNDFSLARSALISKVRYRFNLVLYCVSFRENIPISSIWIIKSTSGNFYFRSAQFFCIKKIMRLSDHQKVIASYVVYWLILNLLLFYWSFPTECYINKCLHF